MVVVFNPNGIDYKDAFETSSEHTALLDSYKMKVPGYL